MTKKTAQITAFATRDFNDTTGVGASYKAGEEIKADEATIANYAACGLVAETKPEAPATTVAG